MKKITLTLVMLSLIMSMAACSQATDSSSQTSSSVESSSVSDTSNTTEEKGYTETVIKIDAGDHEIPATVSIPNSEGKHPAVVMLHGTGSNRDEVNGAYTYVAATLAEEYGIASIRIDFMGSGDSTEDYTRYTFKSAAEDASKAADYIAGLENIDKDKIAVMGWSQGGKDALLSAAWYPETFKSVVTWAGAPDMTAKVTDEIYAEATENGYFVMDFDWREPLHGSLQWCDDVKNTNVLEEFSAFTGPVLAVHGTKDTTVDPEWSNKIVAANKNESSKTFFIENMDHTFNMFAEQDFKSLYTAIDATDEFLTEMFQ